MENFKLTKRQQQVYDYVREFTLEKGYPPSVREIADAVGLSSPSTVHSHLSTLEKMGLLVRDPSKPRALTVVTSDEYSEPLEEVSTYDGAITTLPLVGRVAAGAPILAEQNIEEHIPMPTAVIGDSASFMLQVRGESMVEAGIFDGDYIVVKEQNTARNGEIVVALIDDEATVKTFYKEQDRIRLQPENRTMNPIYVQDCLILGKVVALFRTI